MARAIWTGSVGFGLVQIPVSLHGAEEPEAVDLTLLDRRDMSPVGYQRVNKATGEKVEWGDIVKGYEHEEGKYVVLTKQDFEQANPESARQIDILDFVEFSEIDPRFLFRPYYLKPQKAGKKAYALLRETLQRTGKAGIGKVVIRTRQHLAAVTAHEKVLLLVLLRFADELRDEADLGLDDTDTKKIGVTAKELDMAEKLVEGMVTSFNPKKYVNEYQRDLKTLIERRVAEGALNTLPGPTKAKAKRPTNVIDLAALLAKSVANSPERPASSRSKAARKTTSAKATKRPRANPEHRRSA